MRKLTATLTICIIFAAILSAADSAKSLFEKGVKAEARGDYEAAFEFFKAAYQAKPSELRYRVPYERTRILASSSKVKRGQKLRDAGNLQDALKLFQEALEVDPSNDLAAQEIRRTQVMIQKGASSPGQAGVSPPSRRDEDDPLRQRLETASGPVSLTQIPDVPLSALEMTDDSKVLYETIGKLANINVLFDPDYTSRRLTIKLQKVNLQEALDILALESRTFWRPVTPNTIFVAQDTQAKRRELEQNVVKTFYLGNVSGPTDLQDIVNAIRTVLEVQRIQQIPSQSAIVIKGTPDQLALASKMIDDIDKSKPEVIVDVYVMQVRRDKLRNMGITPPQNFQVALQGTNTTTSSGSGGSGSTSTSSSSGGLNFNDLQHLNSTNYAVTIDSLKAVAIMSDADSKILQSPRIRATDNEKATLTIADKIPIATGSFGTPLGVGTAVGAVGVNTQFNYTDVGVKMEITPRVHPDGQVTLKTSMEISNLNGSQTIGGITQPIISTRKVEHTIRLADGETNLLGGILEVQDTKTTSGAPLLGEIPILKYIFTSTSKEHVTNELVFLLIPHIVRGQELNDLNRRAFDVGTGTGSIDLRIAARPMTPSTTATAVAPAGTTTAPSQPAAPVTPSRQPVTPPQTAPAQTQTPATGQPGPTTTPAQQTPQQQPATPAQAQPSAQQNLRPGQVGLRLDPAAASATVGNSFTLKIVLTHGQDVAAVPIQITYDPKSVQFNSVTNGEFLAKDGQQVILVNRDDPSSGKLQITAQRPPGMAGVSGDGVVFNLVFTGKAKGTSTIFISVPAARNSQNQPLDVLGSQAAITVN
ncbi:MAG TPA: cohesin domain-containing protein [Candidatus Angelobacter sp.]|nr:cohesin domain-containing protein [Candidatus Angelobacter sp.]